MISMLWTLYLKKSMETCKLNNARQGVNCFAHTLQLWDNIHEIGQFGAYIYIINHSFPWNSKAIYLCYSIHASIASVVRSVWGTCSSTFGICFTFVHSVAIYVLFALHAQFFSICQRFEWNFERLQTLWYTL